MAGPNLQVPRVVEGTPPELVVYDREQSCPYLKSEVARLPLRLPSRPLTPEELSARLAGGDRRQGFVLYRPSCQDCVACEPIRLSAHEYSLSRSQRRLQTKNDAIISTHIGPPTVDDERIQMYNTHKEVRGLRDDQPPMDEDGYRDFLVASCCDTFELSYFLDGQLVGIAIRDRADQGLSAVYCCYDPKHSRLGIGTYSILTQLRLCRQWNLPYLYLGLYIQDCASMEYKARYLPHERLRGDSWIKYSK